LEGRGVCDPPAPGGAPPPPPPPPMCCMLARRGAHSAPSHALCLGGVVVWGTPTTALWMERIGVQRAKRLLFTGDLITGKQAVEWCGDAIVRGASVHRAKRRRGGARRARRGAGASRWSARRRTCWTPFLRTCWSGTVRLGRRCMAGRKDADPCHTADPWCGSPPGCRSCPLTS